MKQKNYNLKQTDNIEQIEEEIISAANKTGRKNVIVNIFSFPAKRLKRRWHIRYKFNKKHLIMDLLICAGILFLIGLNIFWLYGGFHYFVSDLKVAISAPSPEILSGQIVSFDINYANDNSYKIEEAILSLRFPRFFQLTEISHKDFDRGHNVLDLGELKPGSNGAFRVTGRVLGGLNDEQSMIANINYYKTSKSGTRLFGQYEVNSEFKYKISGSFLTSEVMIPTHLINKEIFSWPVKIVNTSSDIVYSNIKVVPMTDNGIFFDQSEILFEKILPGEKRDGLLSGVLKTDQANKVLSYKVFWQEDLFDLLQVEWQKNTNILQPKFILTHDLDKIGAVNPGEWVEINVAYENAGDYTLENVELSLNFTGAYWDLSQVKKDKGRIISDQISWNFNDLPRLALIQPHEKGQIRVNVKTKEFVADSQAFNLISSTLVKYKIGGQAAAVLGDEKTLRLNSNLSATVYPMYFALTGDQLGRGPLPPDVGKETKYWIFVKFINDISIVKNAQVKIELPANVIATGNANVPVGDPIQFSNNKRELIWQISEVPVKPTNIGFAFEAAIIPTSGQLGTYPALIANIIISGTDSMTKDKIEKQFGAVTTKLTNDLKGKARDGAVR